MRRAGTVGAATGRMVGFANQHIYVTLRSSVLYEPPMPPRKIATLNLRIDPDVKEAARVAAQREHRSVANLIEMLIRRHCEAERIPIPKQSQLFDVATHDHGKRDGDRA